ncbi:uncharacterized protein LOC129317627 isoform X2 [Prosopis cineraria]|uniref:uncharacterized protein LOC129317627 isoform X2 n=1 Tax=Prosopis cineraria TaxID=364024 RepID=UPI00240FDAA3|nr:uncharacterized protein LOC129317627 isoform X2 [Prosopis cineraria]
MEGDDPNSTTSSAASNAMGDDISNNTTPSSAASNAMSDDNTPSPDDGKTMEGDTSKSTSSTAESKAMKGDTSNNNIPSPDANNKTTEGDTSQRASPTAVGKTMVDDAFSEVLKNKMEEVEKMGGQITSLENDAMATDDNTSRQMVNDLKRKYENLVIFHRVLHLQLVKPYWKAILQRVYHLKKIQQRLQNRKRRS